MNRFGFVFDGLLSKQVALLQDNQEALRLELAQQIVPDTNLHTELVGMGFQTDLVNVALRLAGNNMASALEELLRLQDDDSYDEMLKKIVDVANVAGPSSAAASAIDRLTKSLSKAKKMDEVCLSRISNGNPSVQDECHFLSGFREIRRGRRQ